MAESQKMVPEDHLFLEWCSTHQYIDIVLTPREVIDSHILTTNLLSIDGSWSRKPNRLVRVGVKRTTLGVVESSRSNILNIGAVDTIRHPSKETVGNRVAQPGILEKGVNVGGLGGQYAVLGVRGQGLGVGVVRRVGLDSGDEGLVKEALADVAGLDVVVAQRAVGEESGILVDKGMNVSGAARVVTGENGGKFGHAVGVGRCDAA
jgi:hypothetical protein